MRRLTLIAAIAMSLSSTTRAQSAVQITTVVDFGPDRGQNFGTRRSYSAYSGNSFLKCRSSSSTTGRKKKRK